MLRVTVAAVALAVMALEPQRPPFVTSGDLVELDVVVVGRDGETVPHLRRDDFEIKDDGKRVDIKTFQEVTAAAETADNGRSVVLLLDDVGVPRAGAAPMRRLARVMLSSARSVDDVAVVRLSKPSDEAFGDMVAALDRIDGYAGGAAAYSLPEAREASLKAVARISGNLGAIEHRRKVILCIGLRPVCDIREPMDGRGSPLWQAWVEALSAAARANVSVYAVDPTGANQRAQPRPYGLIEMTGGSLFAKLDGLEAAHRAIWWEASRYYLLGYWPPEKRGELHSIDVKVTRKDLHVRARRRR